MVVGVALFLQEHSNPPPIPKNRLKVTFLAESSPDRERHSPPFPLFSASALSQLRDQSRTALRQHCSSQLPSQRGQPNSPNTSAHVPTPASPNSHQSLLLLQVGNSQTLLLLPEICPGMAVSHALETCRDAASEQLYQIPSSPAKLIGSVGSGTEESMFHLLSGLSARAANAGSHG